MLDIQFLFSLVNTQCMEISRFAFHWIIGAGIILNIKK